MAGKGSTSGAMGRQRAMLSPTEGWRVSASAVRCRVLFRVFVAKNMCFLQVPSGAKATVSGAVRAAVASPDKPLVKPTERMATITSKYKL